MRLGLFVVALTACRVDLTVTDTGSIGQVETRVTASDVAVLCAGASRSQGGGFVAETCTAPLDATVGRSEGSGYTWIPGPSEIVLR